MSKRSADAAWAGQPNSKRPSGTDLATSYTYDSTAYSYDSYGSAYETSSASYDSSYSVAYNSAYDPNSYASYNVTAPTAYIGPVYPKASATNTTYKPTYAAPAPVPPTTNSTKSTKKGKAASVNPDGTEKKAFVRAAGGEIWKDDQLAEWDENDFRIFVGDIGNDCTDEQLAAAFRKYPSFQKAKIIRDKYTNKPKGYGFVSIKDPADFTKAMREMNGKYVGNRPIKLRKSNWRDRNLENRDLDEVKRLKHLKNSKITA